jgi:hypothetical protein
MDPAGTMRGSQGLAADGIPDPSFADQALRRPPTERGATRARRDRARRDRTIGHGRTVTFDVEAANRR